MNNPTYQTLGDVLRETASVWPDKIALEMLNGKSVTFDEINRRVNALNNAVFDLGVRKGARVAVLSKNRTEYVESYGLSKSGYIVVPLNWRLTAGELIKLINHSAPEVLIADEHHFQLIESIRDQLSTVRHYILIGGKDQSWHTYEDLLDSAADTEPAVSAEPDDVLCVIYTSGTTGAPKGVALSHAGAVGNCVTAAGELRLTEADVTMAVMPLFHAGGMWYHLFPSLACGTTSLLLSDFDPGKILQELELRQITNVHLAPTMVSAILAHPSATSADLSSVRVLFYAASSMPAEVLRRAMRTFPRCGFVQGYGSTEAGVVTILSAEDHRRAIRDGKEQLLLSCGRPYPRRQVRLVNDKGV
ncbi:MAG TPA: AMP-binding protein, partial [Candidatus Sulfotelmatobacter sp.]|nr:AMP-binding protein [Candidatus Sulfotelmatobacter sp.]